MSQRTSRVTLTSISLTHVRAGMQDLRFRQKSSAACCHLVENDSAFRCIGSRLANHAGGRRLKERERSRTGADNTSVCRRYTSSRLVWENPNNRGGNYRRVRCDVRGSDRRPGCPVPRMCSFLGHPVSQCPIRGCAPPPTRPGGQTQPVGGQGIRTYKRWR
jgi:hypothetical protein